MPDETEDADMQAEQDEPTENDAFEQLRVNVDTLDRKIEDLKAKAIVA